MNRVLTLLVALLAFTSSQAQTLKNRWYNEIGYGSTNTNCNNVADQARNSYSWRLEFPRLYQGSASNYDVTHTSSGFPDPQKVNYSLEWDGVKQGNRWTVYQLTKTNLTKNVDRNDSYGADPNVPSNLQPSKSFISNSSYKGTYNRGHLCPSADRLYSREVNTQVMYMTNIMAENTKHNSGTWGTLEQTVRGWLTSGKMDTLYVVKAGTIDDKHLIGYIGTNKYPIPKYMYMAFLGYNKSSKTFHAMAALSENTASGTTSYVTVDSLENLTGIDLFCNLPDEIENSVEADASSTNASYWGVSSIIAAKGTNTNVDPTPDPDPDTPSTGEGSGTETDPYTVSGLLNNWATGKTVTVTGYVTKVGDFNSKYGELDYYIADEKGGTTTFYIYNGYGLDGAKFTSTGDLQVGWKVTVTGTTKEYNGTKEFNYGSKIIKIEKGGSTDNPDTPTGEKGTETNPYTVAEAEAILTAGTQTTSPVYVKGIICKVGTVNTTYKDLNYYISDDGTTANQLYVYAGKYINGAVITSDGQLQVGDKVVIKGVLYNYTKNNKTTQEINKGSQIVTLAVPVSISASEYSTLYWSNRNFTIPKDVKVYTYTVGKGKLVQAEVKGTIPAGEAVVLNAAEGSYDFYVTTTAGTKASANDLYGTDTETAITNNSSYYYYMLSYNKNGEKVGFYWGAANGAAFTNGAHRAYLKVLKSNAAGAKGFGFEDETTGIEAVQSSVRIPHSAIYNLNGQRVSPSYRGVVIINGKKYIK